MNSSVFVSSVSWEIGLIRALVYQKRFRRRYYPYPQFVHAYSEKILSRKHRLNAAYVVPLETSTFLTADLIFFCTKKPIPNW